MGIAAAAADAALRRGPGGGRRRHVDPGLTAADAGVPRLDGAQHREGADRRPRRGAADLPGRDQGRRHEAAPYAPRLAAGRSFIYHLAEGTAPGCWASTPTCARPAACTPTSSASTRRRSAAAEYADWAGRGAGAIVWSPFSNIWLYGGTTDVLAARRHGLLVCLGSDWAPSGTKNLLGELKVAALWNDEALGGALDARDLGMMATANAGDALRPCWGVDVGRLRAGALADVLVTTRASRRRRSRTRTCCASTSAACGWSSSAAGPCSARRRCSPPPGATHVEPLDVGGVAQGRRDAAARRRCCRTIRRCTPRRTCRGPTAWPRCSASSTTRPAPCGRAGAARAPTAGAPVPLEFEPDMPGPGRHDGGRALTDDELDQLVVPPVQSLAHDAAWFADVDRAKPHAAVCSRRPASDRGRRALTAAVGRGSAETASRASLVTRLAPAAATSRRIAWSLVTTTTGRSTGVASTSARMTSSAITPGGRVHDPGQPPPRGMGTDDVGAVEHDGDVGAEAAGDVVDEVEAAARAGGRGRRRARPAWRRCSRRRARARRRPAAGARSPAGSRGRPRRATAGRPGRPSRPR